MTSAEPSSTPPPDLALDVQAARDRRWRRLVVAVIIAWFATTWLALVAILVVAERLDRSAEVEKAQVEAAIILRCDAVLQGQWNGVIVPYVDDLFRGVPVNDPIQVERRDRLIEIARQQGRLRLGEVCQAQ